MDTTSIRSVLSSELRSGEKLLWVGSPARFPVYFSTLFPLLWAGGFVAFGLFALISALISATASGIIFMLIWLSFVSIFFYIHLRRLTAPSKQIYAITDQRGIILELQGQTRVASLSLAQLKSYERRNHGKLATLSFSQTRNAYSITNYIQPPLDTFHMIDDHVEVERLIQSASK